MITLADYWMGRDKRYAADLTEEIRLNAQVTVDRVNRLLEAFGEERAVTSGWRPPSVNAKTKGAALRSKHMLGQACDLADPEGDLDEFLLGDVQGLINLELWMEHPAATKGWCHVQIVAPKSGKRIFYP